MVPETAARTMPSPVPPVIRPSSLSIRTKLPTLEASIPLTTPVIVPVLLFMTTPPAPMTLRSMPVPPPVIVVPVPEISPPVLEIRTVVTLVRAMPSGPIMLNLLVFTSDSEPTFTTLTAAIPPVMDPLLTIVAVAMPATVVVNIDVVPPVHLVNVVIVQMTLVTKVVVPPWRFRPKPLTPVMLPLLVSENVELKGPAVTSMPSSWPITEPNVPTLMSSVPILSASMPSSPYWPRTTPVLVLKWPVNVALEVAVPIEVCVRGLVITKLVVVPIRLASASMVPFTFSVSRLIPEALRPSGPVVVVALETSEMPIKPPVSRVTVRAFEVAVPPVPVIETTGAVAKMPSFRISTEESKITPSMSVTPVPMPPVEVIENEPDFVPEQISNFVVVPVTVQPKVCVAFASFEPTALNPIPPHRDRQGVRGGGAACASNRNHWRGSKNAVVPDINRRIENYAVNVGHASPDAARRGN